MAQAQEALGRSLSPVNTPEFLKDLRELSARDPELARELLRAVRAAQAPKDAKAAADAKRVAKQATSAMRSSERIAALKDSIRRLRDRLFTRPASLAGKKFKVPRKNMVLLALLLLALGVGYTMIGLVSSPPKKPQSVVGISEDKAKSYAQADYQTLAAEAEKTLGKPLPQPGTREFDQAVAELQRKDPALAKALKDKGGYQAALEGTKKDIQDVAQGKQDVTAGTGMEALKSVPPGPPAPQGGQGQGGQGQGQEAVPPPPVPPPPTAPAQSAAPSPGDQPVGPFDLAVAPPTRPSFYEGGAQAQAGGQAEGGAQGGEGVRARGFFLVEANRKPPEVVAQETPPREETKAGLHFVDRPGAASSPLVVDRSGGPSGASGLLVVDRAGERQGAPQNQGFTVLAERNQSSQPASPSGSGTPPGIGPYDLLPPPPGASSQGVSQQGSQGAQPTASQPQAQGAYPSGSPSYPSLGSGSLPQPQAQRPGPASSPSPSSQDGVGGSGSSSSRFVPGRFYTARLNTKIVVVEGGTSPAVLEGADGTIWTGTASLNPLGRVEINLDTAYLPGGGVVRVRAMVYDQDRQLGLQASVREEAPSLAQDLLRASASAFGQYVEYLSKQTSVVQLPGGGVAQTQQAPPLEYVLLGQVGKLFQLPDNRKSLVRIGEVLPGKVVQVVVLGGS